MKPLIVKSYCGGALLFWMNQQTQTKEKPKQ